MIQNVLLPQTEELRREIRKKMPKQETKLQIKSNKIGWVEEEKPGRNAHLMRIVLYSNTQARAHTQSRVITEPTGGSVGSSGPSTSCLRLF